MGKNKNLNLIQRIGTNLIMPVALGISLIGVSPVYSMTESNPNKFFDSAKVETEESNKTTDKTDNSGTNPNSRAVNFQKVCSAYVPENGAITKFEIKDGKVYPSIVEQTANGETTVGCVIDHLGDNNNSTKSVEVESGIHKMGLDATKLADGKYMVTNTGVEDQRVTSATMKLIDAADKAKNKVENKTKKEDTIADSNYTFSFPIFTDEKILNDTPDKIKFEPKGDNPYGLTKVKFDDGTEKTYRTYGKNNTLDKLISGFQDNLTSTRDTYNGLLYVSKNSADDLIRYVAEAQKHNPEKFSVEQFSALIDVVAFTSYMSEYIGANIDENGKVIFDEERFIEFKDKYSKLAISPSGLHKAVMWTHPLGWAEMLFNGISYDRNNNITGHGLLNYRGNQTFLEGSLDDNRNVNPAVAVERLNANKVNYIGALGLVNGGNKNGN